MSHSKPKAEQEAESKFSSFWLLWLPHNGNCWLCLHSDIYHVLPLCQTPMLAAWGDTKMVQASRLQNQGFPVEKGKPLSQPPWVTGEENLIQCRQIYMPIPAQSTVLAWELGEPRVSHLCLTRSVMWAKGFTSLISASLVEWTWTMLTEPLLCEVTTPNCSHSGEKELIASQMEMWPPRA